MDICLQREAYDLHMVRLIPMPPNYLLLHQLSRMVCLSGANLPSLSWKTLLNERMHGCMCVHVHNS